jgi:hypothetical protein
MPAAPTAPIRLLRALTIALAVLFTLPACFTTMVWSDDRSRGHELREEAPALQAFRLPGASGEFVVSVPPAAVGPLQAILPTFPNSARWLQVQPKEHTATAAIALAMAAAKGVGVQPQLAIVEEGGTTTLRLRVGTWGFPSEGSIPAAFTALPGVAWRAPWMMSAWRELDLPCEAAALTSRPDDAAEELHDFVFVHEVVRDDGTHLLARIAWTPFALLGDVLTSPIQLLALLMN